MIRFYYISIKNKTNKVKTKKKPNSRRKMKIQLLAIILIIKTFLLSQNGVEAGPTFCQTDADCISGISSCMENSGYKVCVENWVIAQKGRKV